MQAIGVALALPEAQRDSFFLSVGIAVAVGVLLGGIFAQEKFGTDLKFRFLAKRFVIWGSVFAVLGIWWGFHYLEEIYQFDCIENKLLLWRPIADKPVTVSKSDVAEIRLGMTSARGQRSWVVRIWLANGKNYSTVSMTHKDAVAARERMNSILSGQDSCS